MFSKLLHLINPNINSLNRGGGGGVGLCGPRLLQDLASRRPLHIASIHKYTRLHAYISMHTYMHIASIHKYIHTYSKYCIARTASLAVRCTQTLTPNLTTEYSKYTYIYIHIHACIYVYIYIYMYMYIHVMLYTPEFSDVGNFDPGIW